jgi:lactoylglutathione lyase
VGQGGQRHRLQGAELKRIDVPAVDHIGVRVRDLERAMQFYAMLGFQLEHKAANDAVAVVRNAHGVELNLVFNANADAGGKNILMDVVEKYAGWTHVALRVSSIKATIEALREHGVRITQGPVSFGRDGHVSVFVRDPDLNVVELRGRDEDLSSIGGVVQYLPEN